MRNASPRATGINGHHQAPSVALPHRANVTAHSRNCCNDMAAPVAELGDDRSERLREFVDRLPERLRRVLVLYYFEDRSIEEVADMLGCPQGTVNTSLFRARGARTSAEAASSPRGVPQPAEGRARASFGR